MLAIMSNEGQIFEEGRAIILMSTSGRLDSFRAEHILADPVLYRVSEQLVRRSRGIRY